MTKTVHNIFIFILVTTVLLAFLSLCIIGFSYYSTGLEERFFHPGHSSLKPSGTIGHGSGIIGSLLILIGVFSYMARKRFRRFSRIGILKYWLEFHIFLCVLGPVLVLFHTAFKFGGIVSISFWSMVIVVISGVIGRFIYIQIPRTIEGREMSLNEIRKMKNNISDVLKSSYATDDESYMELNEAINSKFIHTSNNLIVQMFMKHNHDRKTIMRIKLLMKHDNKSKSASKRVMTLVRNEIAMNNRIERLQTMQKLFKFWHVAHLPFALVMLTIMVIHVVVTLLFGYKWIF